MKFDTRNNSRDFKYLYKRFYKIFDHQLLKTRALKRENPKIVGFYETQGIPNPGLDRSFTWV